MDIGWAIALGKYKTAFGVLFLLLFFLLKRLPWYIASISKNNYLSIDPEGITYRKSKLRWGDIEKILFYPAATGIDYDILSISLKKKKVIDIGLPKSYINSTVEIIASYINKYRTA